MVDFGILGPLVVRDEAGDIRVAGARRRALLVRLLVTANELVPSPVLVEDLWAGAPPSGAASTLQSHIRFLRQTLRGGRLVGHDGGYELEVADNELDVRMFESESRQAREALDAGDPGLASTLFSLALGRWRGAALADVSGTSWALPEQTRLEELRVGALEAWLEARLQLGEHQEVVSAAEAAVADHPFREGIWGHLMLALYRSDRQADALRAYQRLRTLLAEELGIEPSAHLVDLDSAIVQQKPELQRSQSGSENVGPRRSQDAEVRSRSCEPVGGNLPSGTVTLLFTDIERSTQLWEKNPDDMGGVLARHDEIVRSAVADAGGYVFKTVGDGTCAAFVTPHQALAAAVAIQRALRAEPWPPGTPLRVRMAVHSGVCEERDGDYFGPTVNRLARLTATAHGGQIVVSGTSAQLLTGSLPDGVELLDLGEHRLRDLYRPERVFQLVAVGLERDFPSLRSLTTSERQHNLPEQISSFVGRTSELAEIRHRLGSSRLVSLVGPGGAGKTRLALHTAADFVDGHGDGVWLVELAAVSDPAMVVRSVARTLLVREDPDCPLADSLNTVLRDRDLLLVLDNCEQVLQSSAMLAGSLLEHCPGLSILATSREPLGISGEAIIRVSSMAVPPEGVVDPVALDGFESVRLFVERASEHHNDFRLDEVNAVAVASICRCLDGIPLAIELAAVRTRALTPAEIGSRLSDRFRLLTGGSRTVAPRHQTLHAVIDWSHELLTPREQAVLRRLSVFEGGWTLEEAEVVTIGDDVEHWEVLDLLSALVDKSLIQCDSRTSVSRYGMLESVRQFAAEKLSQQGDKEVSTAQVAHGRLFLTLAENAAIHLHDAHQHEWLDRLESDHENLRTALRRFVRDPLAVEEALRMGVALHTFWLGRGYNSEGVESLTSVLVRGNEPEFSALRGMALHALGLLFLRQGQHEKARGALDEALTIARHLKDLSLETSVLAGQAWLGYVQGDGAITLADEAVSVARRCADPRLLAVALERRADVASSSGQADARADYSEALSMFRQVGDVSSVGEVLSNLAVLELEAGDISSARSHLDGALDILAEGNRIDVLSAVLFNLGVVSLLQKEFDEAQTRFVHALVIASKSGTQVDIGYAFLGLALCATGVREHVRGAMLHGAADALLEQCGETLQPLEGNLQKLDRIRLQRAMEQNGFIEAQQAGRALTLGQAIALARNLQASQLDSVQ